MNLLISFILSQGSKSESLAATHRANASKSEKLPGDLLLKEAHPRVVNWWEQAIVGTSCEEQFYSEAEASLPLLVQERSVEGVLRECYSSG